MYVKANVQFVLKNKPKGHIGLTQARYSIDRPESESLARLLCGLVESACEAVVDMGIIDNTDQLQKSLEHMRQFSRELIVIGEKGAN